MLRYAALSQTFQVSHFERDHHALSILVTQSTLGVEYSRYEVLLDSEKCIQSVA